MLHNYLKIAFRNLLRYKGFSLINIFGLGLGLASSILILLWVADELNFDKFHTNSKNIYRITARLTDLAVTSSTRQTGPNGWTGAH